MKQSQSSTVTATSPTSDASSPLVRLACAGLGVSTFVFGVWAFAIPHSFFDHIASFPPYNRHLLHDAGVLQIGIGVALLLAAARLPGSVVGLGGFVAFEGLHVLSHIIDRDLGGHPARDITFLAVLTLIGAAALVGRLLHR